MTKKVNKRKSVAIEWNNRNSSTISAQDAMYSPDNNYQHLDEVDGTKGKVIQSKDYYLLKRGKDNVAPQKDILLGRRSITHKKIATQLSRLVAGGGIEFYIKDPESGDLENLSAAEQAQLDEANSWLKKGLSKSWQVIANGLTYQNISSAIVTTNVPRPRPEFGNGSVVIPQLRHIVAKPSEQLRYSKPVMNYEAEEVIKYHFYHENWGFNLDDYDKDERFRIIKTPEIISIDDFIIKSQEGKETNNAYAIPTQYFEDALNQEFLSFSFELGSGVFDGAYPIPEWKANSSINDIQAEFESSCIRIDYLRNGMHVFAIVNVYSAVFTDTTGEDNDDTGEKWAESLEIVKSLKGSYASGRVIVNPVGTEDRNKDGMIEVQSLDLTFPVEANKYFNEEARSAILTAWGVAADLFSVSKPEKNNLRSQEGFLKVSILLLEQSLQIYRQAAENGGLADMLKFFGLDKVSAKVKPAKRSIFLAVLYDNLKDVVSINELRKMLFDLEELHDEDIARLLAERQGDSDFIFNKENEQEDDM